MISLVLCTLGQREYDIKKLYDSLSEQTYQSFEVILVTQGNHDLMDEIIRGYSFNFTHIRSNTKGLSVARNIGLKYIAGEYFTITDDDCFYADYAFEKVMQKMESTHAAAICFKFQDFDTKQTVRKYETIPIQNISMIRILGVASIEIFFKTSAVSNIRFDESFGVGSFYNSGEEAIYLRDIKKECKAAIAYCPDNIVFHKVKGKSQYMGGDGVVSKAAIFRRIYGPAFGIFIFILFVLKNINIINIKYLSKSFCIFFKTSYRKDSLREKVGFLCQTIYHAELSYLYQKHLQDETIRFVFMWDGNNSNIKKIAGKFDRSILVSGKTITEYKSMLKTYFLLQRVSNKMKRYLRTNPFTILFVYNDQNVISRLIIQLAKKYNPSVKIILIEEGFALYDSENHTIGAIKKAIFKLLFIPGPYGHSIGANTKINVIIARKPGLVPSFKRKGKLILQQSVEPINDFYLRDYMESVLDISITQIADQMNCDYLYIGQPLLENGIDLTTQIQTIEKVFSLISPNKLIIIKPHPREDAVKYNTLLKKMKNVSLITENLKNIPAEIIYKAVPSCTLVTVSSSAGINASYLQGKPPILLYNLFALQNFDEQLRKLTGKNALVPHDYEELKSMLNSQSYNVLAETLNDPYAVNKEDITYIKDLLNGGKYCEKTD